MSLENVDNKASEEISAIADKLQQMQNENGADLSKVQASQLHSYKTELRAAATELEALYQKDVLAGRVTATMSDVRAGRFLTDVRYELLRVYEELDRRTA